MSEVDSNAEIRVDAESRDSVVAERARHGSSMGSAAKAPGILRRTTRTQLLAMALVVLAISLLLLLLPLPRYGRVFRSATDLWHAPLFALVSFLAMAALHRLGVRCSWRIAIGVWLAFSVGGAIVELLQGLVGRHTTISDGIANTCGSFAGVLLAFRTYGTQQSLRDGRFSRPIVYSIAAVLILVPTIDPLRSFFDATRQWLEFPSLASFESLDEVRRISMTESIAYRDQHFATEGDWSLKVELDTGKYPGISIEPFANWTGYSFLEMDVFLSGDEPLEMVVKITDRAHNNDHWDRFHQRVFLVPGSNHIKVRLSDVVSAPRGRTFDLEQVAGLSLFAHSLKRRRTIYLDNVRLERMSLISGDD